jgi:hypothetical protein
MPKYKSLFASAESVQGAWDLTGAGEAKKIYDLWDLAYDEVGANKEPYLNLINDAQTYLAQKPGIYDNPDKKYTRVKASITGDQWTRLVNTYDVILLMRSLGTGGPDKQKTFSTMWSGLKGKEKGDADAAKRTAKKFNDEYAMDEFLNYLRHLAGKTKNFLVQKPYVVAAGEDKFNLYVFIGDNNVVHIYGRLNTHTSNF